MGRPTVTDRDNDFRNDATYEEKVEQLRNEAALRAGDRSGVQPGLEPPIGEASQVAGEGKPAGLRMPLEPRAGVLDASIPSLAGAETVILEAVSASQLAESALLSPSLAVLPPAVDPLLGERGSAIQRQAHARLQELLPQAIRKRRLR